MNLSIEPAVPQRRVLKDDRAWKTRTITKKIEQLRTEDEEAFGRIRCPLCKWRPTASSRWCCNRGGTPEPFFEGCGTIWNTFATRGLCPGCGHQWRWTSCLRCHVASLHTDWYEEKSRRGK